MKRLVVAFVFLMGMVAGAVVDRLGHRFWMPRPPDPERIASRLAKDLGLDEGQRTQLRAIIQDADRQMRAMHEETVAKFDALHQNIQLRIGAILRPEQKQKFNALDAKWEQRRKKGWGPPFPPLR